MAAFGTLLSYIYTNTFSWLKKIVKLSTLTHTWTHAYDLHGRSIETLVFREKKRASCGYKLIFVDIDRKFSCDFGLVFIYRLLLSIELSF